MALRLEPNSATNASSETPMRTMATHFAAIDPQQQLVEANESHLTLLCTPSEGTNPLRGVGVGAGRATGD
jgi:hypothetical protein